MVGPAVLSEPVAVRPPNAAGKGLPALPTTGSSRARVGLEVPFEPHHGAPGLSSPQSDVGGSAHPALDSCGMRGPTGVPGGHSSSASIHPPELVGLNSLAAVGYCLSISASQLPSRHRPGLTRAPEVRCRQKSRWIVMKTQIAVPSGLTAKILLTTLLFACVLATSPLRAHHIGQR